VTAAWQTRLTTSSERVLQALTAFFARSQVQRWLRLALIGLLLLWLARSLVVALWSFFPPAAPLPTVTDPINPALAASSGAVRRAVDISALLEAELFGAADAAALAETVQARAAEDAASAARMAGIEEDAPETRLPLVLKGVAASLDEAFGQAIIEHQNAQQIYRVGDALPVSGRVTLAKVLPNLVVLDNGGRYEVLRLFDEKSLAGSQRAPDSSLPTPRGAASVASTAGRSRGRAVSDDGNKSEAMADATQIAAAYRERLYADPQSLSQLVSVSDVREDGELIGYRLQPGPSAREFDALGFRAGDLVTAVNGRDLSDPANAVLLYQESRNASEMVFELLRGDETLNITVNLATEQ